MSAGRDGPDALDAPDAPDVQLRRALDDELVLVRERVVAGRMARHGRERLGPAILGVTAGEPSAALAVEALEVGVGPTESRLVVGLLDPRLLPAERHRRLIPPARTTAEPRDAESWLRNLVEDVGHGWRSAWLRACAIHAAGARGLLGRIDLASARALGDPVVDEGWAVRPAACRTAAAPHPDDATLRQPMGGVDPAPGLRILSASGCTRSNSCFVRLR